MSAPLVNNGSASRINTGNALFSPVTFALSVLRFAWFNLFTFVAFPHWVIWDPTHAWF